MGRAISKGNEANWKIIKHPSDTASPGRGLNPGIIYLWLTALPVRAMFLSPETLAILLMWNWRLIVINLRQTWLRSCFSMVRLLRISQIDPERWQTYRYRFCSWYVEPPELSGGYDHVYSSQSSTRRLYICRLSWMTSCSRRWLTDTT